MKLNDLKPAPGSKKNRRRVGRGIGSGRGKTAGRGQKGQKSRSGFSQGSGWEGGRSRLVMRLPKRGFTRQGENYQILNLDDLNVFDKGATVNAETLIAAGFIKNARRPVKLLGDGELTVQNLTIQVDAYSKSAVKAVESAGGTVIGGPEPETAEAKPEAVETKKEIETKKEKAVPEPVKAEAEEVEAETKEETEDTPSEAAEEQADEGDK